jgi:hypothetical protein
MKQTSIALIGFSLGALLAIALLYYNPLTARGAVAADAPDRALTYDVPAHTLSFIHGERALLPRMAATDEPLWEATINRTALLGLTLHDANGAPVATASRLLKASAETDLLLRGVVVSDHWLLTIPNEGTLFVEAEHNLWPFLKETFIPAWYLGRPWEAPAEYRPTVGPAAQRAVVVGATGRFAGREGSAVESYRLTKLDPEKRAIGLSGEIALDLPELDVVAAQ